MHEYESCTNRAVRVRIVLGSGFVHAQVRTRLARVLLYSPKMQMPDYFPMLRESTWRKIDLASRRPKCGNL